MAASIPTEHASCRGKEVRLCQRHSSRHKTLTKWNRKTTNSSLPPSHLFHTAPPPSTQFIPFLHLTINYFPFYCPPLFNTPFPPSISSHSCLPSHPYPLILLNSLSSNTQQRAIITCPRQRWRKPLIAFTLYNSFAFFSIPEMRLMSRK